MRQHRCRPQRLACEPAGQQIVGDITVDAGVLGRMNAAGDENRGQAHCRRTTDIGAHGIADRKDAIRTDRSAPHLGSLRQRPLVDCAMGLAHVDHLAADRFKAFCKRTRAIHPPCAAVNNDIRIGADHAEPALAHDVETFAIIVERLALVLYETAADHPVSLGQIDQGHVQACKDRKIALGTDMMQPAVRQLRDFVAGDVPRCDDAVESIRCDTQSVELALHRSRRPRGVRNEQHRSTRFAEAAQRVAGRDENIDAIVQDAPDIAQHEIAAGCECPEAFGIRHHNDTTFRNRSATTGPTSPQ